MGAQDNIIWQNAGSMRQHEAVYHHHLPPTGSFPPLTLGGAKLNTFIIMFATFVPRRLVMTVGGRCRAPSALNYTETHRSSERHAGQLWRIQTPQWSAAFNCCLSQHDIGG
ncbi:hypothetical protein M378DRAFT_164510 [Amanita muscaria Koide BX008]|uniref:Uncharacterized protein n=1 Tax=Amanita muscaria (strain Koide BX008) TaxID=946122 RepID=A0A0C2T9T9_AMAMK|nr:hypothetical protein M378DRAFT_164510 [Amanita muscaria Koide BX008]